MSAGTLRLERVSRLYDQITPAVSNLTLELAQGELVALVGASGSGKSTTLRIAAGYEQPDEGAVLLDGREITALPPQRRGFGMVFQHYALFPHMSVGDNVAFGLEARGVGRSERRSRARQALTSVGLGDKVARPVQSLSGGEQQRVALARALVIEPPLLLLDEPLSNLDPTLRESTREELRQMLHRLNVTALLVTHDQEDAFAVADRVALLKNGSLLQVGTSEELYDNPVSREVAEFIGRAALVPARDEMSHAVVSMGGRERRLRVRRPEGSSAMPIEHAVVVLRPESLAFASAESDEGWPGVVHSRRFAGGVTVYQVVLEGAHGSVTVEIATPERDVRSGEHVTVVVEREPVALVPG